MKVKMWGVRGSLPKPELPQAKHDHIVQILNEFAESNNGQVDDFVNSLHPLRLSGFGGHTSCVQVLGSKDTVIIDCGSGLKELGLELVQGPAGQGQAEIDILMTHFHWDHLLGLPFFIPIFIPGNKIRFHAVQPELEEMIRGMFRKPYFPVEFDMLGADVSFHQLSPRELHKFGGLKVWPYELDHPDPCWGYRVEEKGRSLAYCVDTECTRVTAEELGPDLPLYQNANLMIFDAQYTLVEVVEKINWGHAISSFGLDIAMREKIDHVLFVHHDPFASFERIMSASNQTKEYMELRKEEAKRNKEELHPSTWSFAQEGMIVEV